MHNMYRINPVFYAFCGIISTTISLGKIIYKDDENDQNMVPFEISDGRETEEDNKFVSKTYRNRRLRSSSYLISSIKTKDTLSKSSSMMVNSFSSGIRNIINIKK